MTRPIRLPLRRPTLRYSPLAAAATTLAALAFAAAPAAAATPGPGWALDVSAQPTNLTSTDNADCLSDINNVQIAYKPCDGYVVTAMNVGSGPTDGSAVTLTDTLPPGLTARKVSLILSSKANLPLDSLCTTAPVRCSIPAGLFSLILGQVNPNDTLRLVIYVTVDPSASGTLTNSATISGGGAPDVLASTKSRVSSAPAKFGVDAVSNLIRGVDGLPYRQAGGHPYALTTRIDLNSVVRRTSASDVLRPPDTVEDLKDVVVDLPLGFMGSALAAPTCTQAQLTLRINLDDGTGGCPTDTIVGHIQTNPKIGKTFVDGPIYNMAAERGVVAQFGYVDRLGGMHVLYARVVPTPAGYVLQVKSPDAPQIPLTDVETTFYGNPSAVDGAGTTPVAMFTNPADCDGKPLTTTVYADSWQNPGRVNRDGTPDLSDPAWASASSSSPPVAGCNKLGFDPSFSAAPTTTVAGGPSGLNVDIKVPQSEDPGTLATPPLRDGSVTLPAGYTVDSSAADGLGACSPSEIALGSAASPACPESSKVGTVQLTTPLLPGTLTGSIYLATQYDNPFHTLLAGYIVVDDPTTGVVIKIPGNLTPDPATGRIKGIFDNNPQFPFSELKLHFKGGDRGVIQTPSSCGSFRAVSLFTPWSAPDSGPGSGLSALLPVSGDCGFGAGFSPSLSAGVENAAAGGSSPFQLVLSRDRGENLEAVDTVLPKGLLAALRGVALCPDSAAATGSCPASSQIGRVTVAAGAGKHPLYIPQAGKAPTAVYLAGPYKGGPYSLVIKVPAQAGPFDLGVVSVRAALYIDPETAQVTVKSDPMPQILDGIPLRYRKVIVSVDRKDFTRSPTSCTPMKVHATVHGAPLDGPVKVTPGGLGIAAAADAVVHLSNRFQVGGCGGLPFKPRMGMRLKGKHQRRDGGHPALLTTVKEPKHQANIRRVRVALPLSLALDPKNSQHVCNYDKAKAVHGTKAPCSKRTIVGKAVAKTPLLPHKLSARIYLVQGIRFNKEGQRIKTLPTLLVPLRGKDHVAIDLRAKTNVSHKKLVTTFRHVPDAQISSFKLRINGGKRGILVVTHNQNICKGAQVTDTSYKGQSGKRYDQRVHMKTPCKGVKKARRARRAHKIKRLRRAAHRAARHGHKTKARKAIRRIHRLRDHAH